MSENVERLIREGVAALKAGRKDEAFQILTRATELDERNEDAWLWLSAVVDNLENQQICLENVLAINPNNARALQGLNMIQQKLENRAVPDIPPGPEPAAPSPGAPPMQSTSPFDLSAPAPSASNGSQSSAPGGYYGSGRQVPQPSTEDYDNWVDGLNLSGEAAEQDHDEGYADDDFGYQEPGQGDVFDPYAMPQAGPQGYAEQDEYDALAELEQFDGEGDGAFFDDLSFEGASPFGAFEAEADTDFQDEERLAGFLDRIPSEIKPTHLPGKYGMYPRGLLIGAGALSLGIVVAVVVLLIQLLA